MISEHKIDPLLNLKKEIENEIQCLLDKLAGKRKTLDSIQMTIDLLRGHTEIESDEDTIKDPISSV